MQIDYCFTEMGLEGKMPKDYPNMRVLESQMMAWDCHHVPLPKVLQEDKKYEGNAVVVLPKGNMEKEIIAWLVQNHFNIIKEVKEQVTGEVWFYQDGEAGYWNQHIVTLQIWWYNNVASCDKIICPNETDIKYYKGMFKSKPVSVMRSIMAYVPEGIDKSEPKTIISGPIWREYNGFDQILIAKHFNAPIWIPPMGQDRMPKDSWDTAGSLGVNYLKYTDWKTWMQQLSSYSYAVNMPGVTCAASFSLNCAWWGIPCVGNSHADTQRICYPETSVEYNDIEAAIKIADKLVEDKEFYNKVSKDAKRIAREEFTKQKFLELVGR